MKSDSFDTLTSDATYNMPSDANSVVTNTPFKEKGTTVKNTCDTKVGELYMALYPYSSTEATDLSFDAGDVISVSNVLGEWGTGSLNGRTGDFPFNYVQRVLNDTPPDNVASKAVDAESATSDSEVFTRGAASSGSRPSQSNGKAQEIASVIAQYKATGPEQVSLEFVGQQIIVRKKGASGWWEGEFEKGSNSGRAQVGWFPANHVKLASPSPGNCCYTHAS